MNEHGNAYGGFEYVKDALASFWLFVGERGSKEAIVTPVLGTGFSRVKVQREEVIREIINSFIAACAERNFCEKLTIVISPHDARTHSIDLKQIDKFVTHVCQYTEYSPTRAVTRGQGIN